MRIKTKTSYNMDILCFLNVMTADRYYTDFHKDAFEKFYPLVSDGLKQKMAAMVKELGDSALSPMLTLFISSLPNFSERNLSEMLRSREEVEAALKQTPYAFAPEELAKYFSLYESAAIPLIAELEAAGFYDYWKESRLPAIEAKRKEVDAHMEQYDIEKLVNKYKNGRNIDNSDFTIYLCSFAHPYGIKLCGNNLITDSCYSNQIILQNVTHEAFHPPYDFKLVKGAVQALAEKAWVKEAFDNQNPNSSYRPIEGFIEENIVEALGIHVMVQLEADIDPMEYFKTHDDGSHVISPYFYEYLRDNEVKPAQPFEDYFIDFVTGLKN